MAGTKAGGLKARDKNLSKDPNFYSTIGKKGGVVKTPNGGFGAKGLCRCGVFDKPHKKAQCAGSLGGRISRRGKKLV